MSKLKLHKPHGSNKWCGPTAMSAITGFSTDECAAVARMVSGKRAIRGLRWSHLTAALDAMGVTLVPFAVPQPTARAAIDALPETVRQRIVIMCAGNHYMTFLRQTMICPLTHRQLTHINSMPKPRAKVARLWLVEFRTEPKLPAMALTKVRNQANATASKLRRETKALATRLGLKIERGDDYLEVSMANAELWREVLKLASDTENDDVNEVFYSDVLCGWSMAAGWAEARSIVESVAHHMKMATGIIV